MNCCEKESERFVGALGGWQGELRVVPAQHETRREKAWLTSVFLVVNVFVSIYVFICSCAYIDNALTKLLASNISTVIAIKLGSKEGRRKVGL